MDRQWLFSWFSDSTEVFLGDFFDDWAAGRMYGEDGWPWRAQIQEGRMVTDGLTPVDGCFNSSLPLYILS